MTIRDRLQPAPPRENGAALVIVLSFVVLLTFVVVAFLTRTTTNRQIQGNSSGIAKAALLARSAGELVVADLKKEMMNSSNASGTAPWQTLAPTNNQSMVPARLLLGGMAADTNFANLVKQSGITSSGGMIPAGTVPTTTPSQDGQRISGLRWSAPKLTGGANGLVNFSDAQVPNWILLTRAGVASSQSRNAAFSNPANSNSSFVIGRFAFNVYDEGGLLDVNVAGYPSSVTGSNASLKGSQGLADLSQIPGISNVDAFVKNWRNMATGQNEVDYLAYLGMGPPNSPPSGVPFGFGPKYGFLKSGTSNTASDNRLLTRQDLVRLADNGTLGITGTALPYLTTFSRSLNAPTYTPDPNRPKVTDPLASRGLDDQFNIGLIGSKARVTKVFTRADGTQSVIGEPLLKHRFPLSRLALLTPTATCTSTVDDPVNNPIYTFFGLNRTNPSDPWVYCHNTVGVKNSILKMSQIQSQAREPDFFELLLSSISIGSLGKGWRTYDQNFYYQILQIGANLIDQYDADSYPTRISFNSGAVEISGIENLPYISRVIANFTRSKPYTGVPLTGVMGLWLQAEVWNPHQQINVSGAGPTSFRFYGSGRVSFSADWVMRSGSDFALGVPPVFASYTFPAASGSSGVQFNLPADRFSTPTLLDQNNAAASDPDDAASKFVDGTKFIGLYTANAEVPVTWWDMNNDPALQAYWAGCPDDLRFVYGAAFGGPVNLFLQYKDANGSWVTYNTIANSSFGSYVGGNGIASRRGNPFWIRVYRGPTIEPFRHLPGY